MKLESKAQSTNNASSGIRIAEPRPHVVYILPVDPCLLLVGSESSSVAGPLLICAGVST